MAYYQAGSTNGLYGITSGTGTYGDANVVLLLSNYLYPISSRANITTTANISGNAVIANTFYYSNGVSLVSTLYSNANVNTFLPIYSGNISGTLTTAAQPAITQVGTLVNLTVSSNINANNNWINNVAVPINATDAASKSYVDSIAQGLSIKAAVNLSTAAALPGYTYNNGLSGVGATITGLSTGLLSIDGVIAPVGGRVLVKNETGGNSPYNGIYTVTTNGSSNYYVLTRSSDMNVPQNFYGAYTYTVAGVSNSGTNWININTCNNPITIGTTAIAFTQFLSGGTYTGGTGININTTAINAVVDNVTVGINGSNQIYATGNLTSANITTATVTNLSVTGNINLPSNLSVGNLTATGTVSASSLVSNSVTSTGLISTTGNVSAVTFLGDGSHLTGMYGNTNVIAFLPTYMGSLSGTTANIVGNVTLGNILNSGISGTGNIGTADNYFDTVFAKATSAQYADLAEMYLADQPMLPGTVVEIGGREEITQSTTANSTRVIGVVSTQPSYLMNSIIKGKNPTPVALIGRVPCRVIGTVRKGDLLVSSNIPGVAMAATGTHCGSVIGKALADYNSTHAGTIEIVVGKV